ncbi:MAG TPA: hypothetical protein VGL72_02905 [Bryobacteraceae bacterium]
MRVIGRVLFALAVAALGVELFIWAAIGNPHAPEIQRMPFSPIMPFVPLPGGTPYLEYLAGIALLPAGLCMLFNHRARLAAIFTGVFFLICTLLLELPRVISTPLDVSIRTIFFESLSFAAIALTLAGLLPVERPNHPLIEKLIQQGPWLFAISSIVFGVDHFLIIPFIASLVPTWIPGATFLSWFTGAAFIATGLAILLRRLDAQASFWLGIMFLIWVLVLHGPRAFSAERIHNPDEWSSAFIALAMCGGSWILALHAQKRGARQPSAASEPQTAALIP